MFSGTKVHYMDCASRLFSEVYRIYCLEGLLAYLCTDSQSDCSRGRV